MNRPSVTGTIAVTDSLSLFLVRLFPPRPPLPIDFQERRFIGNVSKNIIVFLFFFFLSFSRLFLGIEGLDSKVAMIITRPLPLPRFASDTLLARISRNESLVVESQSKIN